MSDSRVVTTRQVQTWSRVIPKGVPVRVIAGDYRDPNDQVLISWSGPQGVVEICTNSDAVAEYATPVFPGLLSRVRAALRHVLKGDSL